MKISVIIPAYNEAPVIAETIARVQDRSSTTVSEIIVVDGGSTDQTVAIARETAATVISSPRKGRAAQMNTGAKQAAGDILYFLHADSLPPVDFDEQILKAISDGVGAGCFQLDFDEVHWLLKSYAWFTQFNIDAFRFGDQSLFIRRAHFFTIGGFREDHLLMEDNELVRRIKSHYSFAILDDVVVTSARSYRKVGIVKLQLIFILIYALYFLGVSQDTMIDIKQSVLE